MSGSCEHINTLKGKLVTTENNTSIDSIVRFTNCLLLRNHQIIKDDLWVRDSKIIDPEGLFYNQKILPDLTIDCEGAIISPGFIDVQLNGKLAHHHFI